MKTPRRWASCSLFKRYRLSELPARYFVVGLLLLAFTALFPSQASAAADLHLEKTAGDVVSIGNNTYRVPITFVITDTGSKNLTNLQLEDDLDIFRWRSVVGILPM